GHVPHPQPRMAAGLGVGGGAAPVLLEEHRQALDGAVPVVLRVHRGQDVVGAHPLVEAADQALERRAAAHCLVGGDLVGAAGGHRPSSSRTGSWPRTRARACSADSAPRASWAISRQRCRVVASSTAATSARERGDIDSEETPRPTRTTAIAGSAAASPPTPTGRPCWSPPRQVSWTMRSTAGWKASDSDASEPSSRSAAIVYWVRSLVPMEAEAARARIGPDISAAAGTSTMTPAVSNPCLAHAATNSSVSSTVAIIGAITHTSALSAAAASAIAASWLSRIFGLRQEVRRPRTPSAGLGSAVSVRNGIGLSAPASRVRTTTFLPGKAASTLRYSLTCSAMLG